MPTAAPHREALRAIVPDEVLVAAFSGREWCATVEIRGGSALELPRRYQSTVRRIPSRYGVALLPPKALAYLPESTTNGLSNWYTISAPSRARGHKRPSAFATLLPTTPTLASSPHSS